MSALDTQTKLGMSLDDLAARGGGGRRIQSGIVGKRTFRRSSPYKVYNPREGNGYGARSGPSRGAAPELCNNCRRTGHFARDCPNAAVCNNCGGSGHIAAACPVEPLCRNCKKPGHIASECRSEPICNNCGKPGHLAKGCAAQEGGIPKAWLCNNCYRPGHLAVDCPNEKACNNCRQPGHLARDCLNSPVCNGCSQPGHIARDCPLIGGAPPPLRGPASTFNPSDMICHNCHQRGHKSKECLQVHFQCLFVFNRNGISLFILGFKLHIASIRVPLLWDDARFVYASLISSSLMLTLLDSDPSSYSDLVPHFQVVICNNCGGRGHLAVECPSTPMVTRGPRRR
ncbi:hypothetical protein M758_4G170700 [Ceratodon purpureus]|nr:hypothetical protein M758_4G170700 [Ceratodon purpureus]